ncbi:OLC1v1024532C1 [Oldenlandia corymbosa var. corymbosa]|uniref:Dirigent protein n=1 Tax=Oldenlandia corymbosa var. corymbosa TaxID=529605 RepID=A0AAV1C3Y1_OLDCO|nr:OLC1v1024532C1 [Oldenlandia corymbosa var. corymbosa]
MASTMAMLMFISCCFGLAFARLPVPLSFNTGSSSADGQTPEAVERWFRDVDPTATPRLTKIRFYYHENRVAANPTTVEIARASSTGNSPTSFGSTMVIDDALTISPDPDSELVGRAQGIYSSASQEDMAFILMFNVVFTSGEFAGSTLSIMARDPITKEFREPSILGGTGAFRLARGAIVTHTYALDPATLNAVVEYNLFVLHY